MAKRKSSRRARSRKPSASRGQAAAPAGAGAATGVPAAPGAPEEAAEESASRTRSQPQRLSRAARATLAYERRRDLAGERVRERRGGSRPQSPWHPLPLSELLILVGLVGVVVAWFRGVTATPALIVASIAAVAIGTLEVTLREHLGGYRSHTILLAGIPVVVFHSGAILVASAFTAVPRWINVPLLAIDVMLFAVLFKLLRLRYLDARRERRFAGGG